MSGTDLAHQVRVTEQEIRSALTLSQQVSALTLSPARRNQSDFRSLSVHFVPDTRPFAFDSALSLRRSRRGPVLSYHILALYYGPTRVLRRV
eukprot:540607-Rhodomonas_salina.1